MKTTVKTHRTFVVIGCPRGGTSLIAGALSIAGVFMGDYPTAQYEDPEFKIQPGEAAQARNRLAPVIAIRNREYQYWGWKLPNNIYYIDRVRDLLIAPYFLFVYRDPMSIAKSSARHDGRDWFSVGDRLIHTANDHTNRVRVFQNTLKLDDYHVFELESIHTNPQAFVNEIVQIVAPLCPDPERLLRFIHPEGGYHALDPMES